jgi:hypothetical protein
MKEEDLKIGCTIYEVKPLQPDLFGNFEFYCLPFIREWKLISIYLKKDNVHYRLKDKNGDEIDSCYGFYTITDDYFFIDIEKAQKKLEKDKEEAREILFNLLK